MCAGRCRRRAAGCGAGLAADATSSASQQKCVRARSACCFGFLEGPCAPACWWEQCWGSHTERCPPICPAHSLASPPCQRSHSASSARRLPARSQRASVQVFVRDAAMGPERGAGAAAPPWVQRLTVLGCVSPCTRNSASLDARSTHTAQSPLHIAFVLACTDRALLPEPGYSEVVAELLVP